MYGEILGSGLNAKTRRRKGEKFQTPTSKLQKNSKNQTFNAKSRRRKGENQIQSDRSQPENRGVIRDMRMNTRVKVAKIIQQTGFIRVESVFVIRLNPLKAMQVVDFPDIEENKGATDAIDHTDLWKGII